ncbi:Serine threonine kinase [Venturia nashicola]|nr:Serine threonine kinase [Venturia nashicola]
MSPPPKIVWKSIPMDRKYHVDPTNPMNMVRHLEAWYPPGVSDTDFIWGGNTARLVSLGDGTVLKFIMDRDDTWCAMGKWA